MPGGAYIGIDLGTSGVRACAIDGHGRVLAEASTPLPASTSPAPGWFEQDPEAWWQATQAVLDRLLATPLPVAAISVDGTSGTLLLTDRDGQPLSQGLMYNDARATVAAQAIAGIAPAEAAVHGPASALARLLWLSEHHPGAHHALTQADWIVGRLGGSFGGSDENNALKLGYDPVARHWPQWLKDCGIDTRLLPEVLPVGTRIGSVQRSLASRWGLPGEVELIAGTTDSNAATLACGLRQPGEAATSLGSTLVLKVLSDHPVFAAACGVYSHRIGGRWLVGGASNSGGRVLRHYFSDARLAELSRQIDPAADSRLDYYPLLQPGERFPVSDPQWPPRLEPRPADDVRFLQGLLEGIARIELRGYRLLHELGAPLPTRVVSSGGGSRNATWQAMRQRLLGCPVQRAAHSEAAYGGALIAAGLIERETIAH